MTDDDSIIGIERDQFKGDDKFRCYVAEGIPDGLGDLVGRYIDPRTQSVHGKTVRAVSRQRSSAPVFLKCKRKETNPDGGTSTSGAASGAHGSSRRIPAIHHLPASLVPPIA